MVLAEDDSDSQAARTISIITRSRFEVPAVVPVPMARL